MTNKLEALIARRKYLASEIQRILAEDKTNDLTVWFPKIDKLWEEKHTVIKAIRRERRNIV